MRLIPLAEWRSKARWINLGGAEIAWWTSSDADDLKPRLLLIHGYPMSSWDWSALWAPLSARFQLCALDMLGFGLSDKPRGAPYAIAAQADLQEALLEQLGADAAHVLAHDYGDTVAQELLARHNEGALSFSLKSVCFLNGGLFPEMHRPRPLQTLGLTPLAPLLRALMTRERFGAALSEIYGAGAKPDATELDGHWALIRERGGEKVLTRLLRYIPERREKRARWVGALLEARAPLRLIVGGADPVSGAHMHRHYTTLVPNADAVLFPEIGHHPHTEAPGETAAAFLAFHDRLAAASDHSATTRR